MLEKNQERRGKVSALCWLAADSENATDSPKTGGLNRSPRAGSP